MLNDPLANVLSALLNAERIGKKEVYVKPVSRTILKVLALIQEAHYIGVTGVHEDTKGNYANIHLIGKVNKCGAIKPRYPVGMVDYERFEKRFLPARDFGLLFVTTSQGIMTHREAKSKNLGGRLLAYIY